MIITLVIISAFTLTGVTAVMVFWLRTSGTSTAVSPTAPVAGTSAVPGAPVARSRTDKFADFWNSNWAVILGFLGTVIFFLLWGPLGSPRFAVYVLGFLIMVGGVKFVLENKLFQGLMSIGLGAIVLIVVSTTIWNDVEEWVENPIRPAFLTSKPWDGIHGIKTVQVIEPGGTYFLPTLGSAYCFLSKQSDRVRRVRVNKHAGSPGGYSFRNTGAMPEVVTTLFYTTKSGESCRDVWDRLAGVFAKIPLKF